MGQKRRRFSREFKEEAVELASRPDVMIKGDPARRRPMSGG